MRKVSVRNDFAVEKWEVLEEKECHWYDLYETKFTAFKVKIGEYYDYDADDNSIHNTRPIIKWMTNDTFFYLRKNSGVMVL